MSKPKLSADIARQLRKFHEVEIPGSRELQLWNDMTKFLEKASGLKFDDIEKQRRYETISFEEVRDAVSELKKSSISLILSMGRTAIEDMILQITLMNMQALIVTTAYIYPDKDAQYHFFRHYLHPDEPQEVPEEDLNSLYVETNTYKLVSHLYWAVWALIQANVSSIDFDYLDYFFLRYKEYKKQKEESFSLAKSLLAGCGTG